MTSSLSPYVRANLMLQGKVLSGVSGALMLAAAVIAIVELFIEGRPSAGLLVLAAALFALGAYWMFLAQKQLRHPLDTATGRELRRHGDVAEISAQLERAALGNNGFRFVNGVLADGWLLTPGFGLAFIRATEIAWAYEKVTSYKVQGVHVGALSKIVVHASAGEHLKAPLEIAVLAKDAKLFLQCLKADAPQAIIGFDAKAAELWKTDPSGALQLLRERPGRPA